MRERLRIVSRERIREELDKLLAGESAGAGALDRSSRRSLAEEFLPNCPRSIGAGPRAPAQGRAAPHVRGRGATRARAARGGSRRCSTTSGSPRPARSRPDGVSFHHHEVVGRGWPRSASASCAIRTPRVEDVRTLVELHLRFHGYGEGWTDAAVRRYVRDAGPLLDELNQLTRAD